MSGVLRVRAVLDSYGGIVLAVCILTAVAGGWVAYSAHATEPTVEETRTVEQGELAVGWEHSARVANVENSTVFSPGERVVNRSVYLERVMPVLDGAVTFDYETDMDAPVRLSVDRRLVVRNVDSMSTGEGERTVYWQRTQALGSGTRTLQPEASYRGTFQVNVTETFREARNESERLGAPGQNQVLVVVEVTASRGDGQNRTRTFVLPIVDESQTYAVQDDAGAIRFNSTRTLTVPATPGPLQAYGGPMLAVAGFLGGALLVAARRRDVLELSDAERAQLAYQNHRNEYADWITTGRLPSQVFDEPRTEVDSLAGLADIAIDTDERVIHDVDRSTYHVVGDGLRYVYEPPKATREDAAAEELLADEDGLAVAATSDETREALETGDGVLSFDEDAVDDTVADDDDAVDDTVASNNDEDAADDTGAADDDDDAADSDGQSPRSSGRPGPGEGD